MSGDRIYFVEWKSDWAEPQLLHIQSIADVELFGINASNYGAIVQESSRRAQRFGLGPTRLGRGVLAAVAPSAAPGAAPTSSSAGTAADSPITYQYDPIATAADRADIERGIAVGRAYALAHFGAGIGHPLQAFLDGLANSDASTIVIRG